MKTLRTRCGRQRSFQRQAEIRARRLRQQLERTAVGVGKLAGNVKTETGAAGSRGEKWLEDLSAQFRGNARTVIAELTNHRVAHVAGAREDADAAFLFLAVLPCVAQQIPGDLVHMSAIEDDQQLA